jgi:transglutaminase-like putative cysteine protease
MPKKRVLGRNGTMKRLHLAIWAILVLATGAPRLFAGEPQFMAIFMEDTKVGQARSLRMATETEITHETDMTITIDRGVMPITFLVKDRTVETPDGKPLSFSYFSSLGPMGTTTKQGVIRDGRIHLTLQSADAAKETVMPYPKDALMGEGADLLMKGKGLKSGTAYSFVGFDTTTLTGLQQDVSIGDPTAVILVGKTAKLILITIIVHQGGTTIPTTSYIDDSMKVMKTEMSMMGMKIKMVACDEAYANSPNGRFDLAAVSIVASPTPIAYPRELKEAIFTLTPIDPKADLVLPTTDSQQVSFSDGKFVVHVRSVTPPPGNRPYEGNDPAAKSALAPGEYVQSDDPEIIRQAREIVGDNADAFTSAKAIEAWVHAYIRKKDYSVGYASAVATLKSATGDCTEHAVLTAALCRAVGLPCRIVIGLAYTPQFGQSRDCFGPHAWNQVFIGGKWTDVDAALGNFPPLSTEPATPAAPLAGATSTTSADAARIALCVGGGDPIDFIGVVQSLKGFRIIKVELPRAGE